MHRKPSSKTTTDADATDVGPIRRLARNEVPRETVALARFLLGKLVVRTISGGTAIGRIVETEAYLADDAACHAYRGMTPRNRSLFLDVGHAYVYLCYGTCHMLNMSSESAGIGAGVLLRALEPLRGVELMRAARPGVSALNLTRGPGRLAAALGVDRRLDGIDLFAAGPLWVGCDGARPARIGDSVRIGLTKAADLRLRYFVADSRHVSGPRRLRE